MDVIIALQDFLERLQWASIITLAVALYGAVLSTYNLRQALKKDRRVVTVKISEARHYYPNGDIGDPMIQVTVTNAGHRPVVANLPTLFLPNGKAAHPARDYGAERFPKHLDDGESETVRFSCKELVRSLSYHGYHGHVRIVPRCSIATGQQFSGKARDLDMRDGTLSDGR